MLHIQGRDKLWFYLRLPIARHRISCDVMYTCALPNVNPILSRVQYLELSELSIPSLFHITYNNSRHYHENTENDPIAGIMMPSEYYSVKLIWWYLHFVNRHNCDKYVSWGNVEYFKFPGFILKTHGTIWYGDASAFGRMSYFYALLIFKTILECPAMGPLPDT